MSEFKRELQEKCESEPHDEINTNRDFYDLDSNENMSTAHIDHDSVNTTKTGKSNLGTTESTLSKSECLSLCKELPEGEDDHSDSIVVTEDGAEKQASSDKEDTETSDSTDQKRSRRFSFDRLSFKNNCWLLYTAAFVLICPVSFFQACAFYSLTFHVVARTSLVGVSASLAGMSLSSLGAGSTFTRLTHGWFIHHGLITATTAYVIALCFGALGAFGNAIAQSYVGVIIACLVVGFSSGSVYPLVPVVLRDLVSLRGLPTTYGLAMFFDSCGVFAGGFTAGLLRDYTGTYTASFCMTGVYYTLATVFLLLVVFITRLHRGRENTELETESSKRLENGDYQNI